MNVAGGGHIVIRSRIAQVAELEAVRDQLGPIKRMKLEEILAADVGEWSPTESHFVLKCIKEALESYE